MPSLNSKVTSVPIIWAPLIDRSIPPRRSRSISHTSSSPGSKPLSNSPPSSKLISNVVRVVVVPDRLVVTSELFNARKGLPVVGSSSNSSPAGSTSMKIRVTSSPLVAGFVNRNGWLNVSPSTTNSISTGASAPSVFPLIVMPSDGESCRSTSNASRVVELILSLSTMKKLSALAWSTSRSRPSTPTPPVKRFSTTAPCPISLPGLAVIRSPARSESSTVRPSTSVPPRRVIAAPTPSPFTEVSSMARVSSPVMLFRLISIPAPT